MDTLLAARLQMTVSLVFHMVFAPVGIGLPLLLVIVEGQYLRTGEPHYKALAKTWAKAIGLLFAVGAVSGTALSLELVVRGWLAVPVAGSVGLFLAGAALHLFATTSLGIFLGTIARSMPQFSLLVILVLLPLEILSGGTTPRESMPDAIAFIMLGAPTTHFVAFAQAVLYRGAGLDVVWPQVLAIGAIGLLFFGVALARFRGALAQMQS